MLSFSNWWADTIMWMSNTAALSWDDTGVMDVRKICGNGAVMGSLQLQVTMLPNYKYKAEIFEGSESKAVGDTFTSMEAAQFWAAGNAHAFARILTTLSGKIG